MYLLEEAIAAVKRLVGEGLELAVPLRAQLLGIPRRTLYNSYHQEGNKSREGALTATDYILISYIARVKLDMPLIADYIVAADFGNNPLI